MRAALYGRVSSKAQAEEEKVSIGEQFAEMEAHCQRKGYEVVQRYQDVGSGSTKRRPDFQRMIADAREGRFDVIVCWKSDRLSRGIYPAAALMEVVEAQRINLESVTDSLDMKTFGIYAAVGKIEIDNFRERSVLGKRGVAKRGKMPIGSIAYGYRIGEDGKPQIEPLEGPVVQRIYREYVHEGRGTEAIARGLTADGVPQRKATKWQHWAATELHRILSRDVYKGTGWYGRERHIETEEGRKSFPQPQDTWILIPYPPLTDEATWQRAQELKQERRVMAKRNTRSFYLLQHLLICEECGLGLTARTNRGNVVRKNGRTYRYEYAPPLRYYSCLGMLRHHTSCRDHSYLKAEPLEELVWSQVKKVFQEPDTIMQGIEAQAEPSVSEALHAEVAKAKREVQGAQSEEERAIHLYVSGKVTEAQLDVQRLFIAQRLERAQAELDNLRARQRAVEQRESLAREVQVWAKEIRVGLDALTPEERQKLLRLVLHRVSINREGNVRITLAIPVPGSVSDAPQPSSSRRSR